MLLAYLEFLVVGGCLLTLAVYALVVAWWPTPVRVQAGVALVRTARGQGARLPLTV